MRLFALADTHLSLGVPDKSMDKFGPPWVGHTARLESNWRSLVAEDDLVLVPGDISWAMRLDGPGGAGPDLEFLGRLPGTKVLVKGNHDYWWQGISTVRRALPAGMFAIQNDAVRVGSVVLAGTRLWDTPGLKLGDIFVPGESRSAAEGAEPEAVPPEDPAETERIYRRELGRLRASLEAMEKLAASAPQGEPILRVALIHYPPCGPNLEPTEATEVFERYRVRHVVFGHLHGVRRDLRPPPFGEARGVCYHLVAGDYLDFRPKLIEAEPVTCAGTGSRTGGPQPS
jgi:predicted phosphohydrolase